MLALTLTDYEGDIGSERVSDLAFERWKLSVHRFAEAVIWITIAIILGVIGFYFVQRFRNEPDLENSTSDHLSNFREMKQRGVLEEKEFRNIKTMLSDKLAKETIDEDSESME